MTYLAHIVNTIAADVLAMQGARPWTAMVLMYLSENTP